MTHPVPTASFTVVPDEVEALAIELGTLAAELTDDADGARAVAASLSGALTGSEGWAAGAAATAWAGLYEAMAGRVRALGDTLAAAAAAYRAQDAALSGRRPR